MKTRKEDYPNDQEYYAALEAEIEELRRENEEQSRENEELRSDRLYSVTDVLNLTDRKVIPEEMRSSANYSVNCQ